LQNVIDFIGSNVIHVDTLDLVSFPEIDAGGTDLCLAFNWALENHFESVIFLKDGYGEAPEIEPMPTLWLLSEFSKFA
jgi:predicted metal-dependent peptidase